MSFFSHVARDRRSNCLSKHIYSLESDELDTGATSFEISGREFSKLRTWLLIDGACPSGEFCRSSRFNTRFDFVPRTKIECECTSSRYYCQVQTFASKTTRVIFTKRSLSTKNETERKRTDIIRPYKARNS